MDDNLYGSRDKRGNWTPNEPLKKAPVFVLPPQPRAFLKWLPTYFLPWNVILMLIAGLTWYALTPSQETLSVLSADWILYLLARNSLGIFLFYGAFQLHFYWMRRQDIAFKYNGKWPRKKDDSFLFGSQLRENLFWTFAAGVPIMTAYEVLILWVFANGYMPFVSFGENPIWLAVLFLLVPLIHEVHFYLVHRLIHIPPLYQWIHSLHHNSVNPAPFSSLSMHPVEHLLYFSGILVHFILPSNPFLAMYHLYFAGYGAVVGHVGFDKVVLNDEKAVPTHAYNHYLHHKYFEVNYSEGLVALDQMFGTFHDGSEDGDRLMKERFRRRRAKLNS
ncbi:sterol desaturase family protein [Flavimaricola marinus]|uniref:Fatty acid hydroxylase superfamily protein n=1 Tax=Flavimaricola marinus TaxID=1819565 RepID=A0A238LJG9_9RHOB|nr:sterol desaturase family protein [Flavimaricola marinus]SMY09768.1 Fatty acid hydroxylase superfamily protein [Flavimaricola marinus]